MRRFPFNFKIEEFIPVSQFVLESYKRDRAEFVKFSPEYDGKHLSSCTSIVDQVDKAINPQTFTAQMKKATETLYSHLDTASVCATQLERYCEKAGIKLPLDKKDLGFTEIRKKCRTRDAEGAVSGLKKAQQLISPYLSVLEPIGFFKIKQEILTKLVKDINEANALQNSLQNERAMLVQKNIEQITNLWNNLNDILKTGKTIFKENPTKVKEYTLTQILTRVRHTLSPEVKEKRAKAAGA